MSTNTASSRSRRRYGAGLGTTTGYQPLLLAAFLVAAVSLSGPARPVLGDVGGV
ncbi:hypothetical protein ACFQE1_10775 [Halobium palmae]|uniref:Uncharacterized protein n=1 Tax=Halobium palmae TaxID=1776492 RepID=A0ABD5RZI9_9EURY